MRFLVTGGTGFIGERVVKNLVQRGIPVVSADWNIDPQAVARAASDKAGSGGAFWLHLDVDVFDQEAFPATDYLMPDGLSVESGHELLRTLGADDRLIGVSVGCYNPEKDPGRQHGRRLVDLLAAAVGRA